MTPIMPAIPPLMILGRSANCCLVCDASTTDLFEADESDDEVDISAEAEVEDGLLKILPLVIRSVEDFDFSGTITDSLGFIARAIETGFRESERYVFFQA